MAENESQSNPQILTLPTPPAAMLILGFQTLLWAIFPQSSNEASEVL